MGIRDKLESLDMLVLEQFEKVTQKAHKELGWTKYDLSRLCSTGSGISMLGMGVYSLIAGTLTREGFSLGIGAMNTILSYKIPQWDHNEDDRKEKKELNFMIETGTSLHPFYSPARLLMLATSATVTGVGLYILFSDTPLRESTLDSEQARLIIRSVSMLFSIYYNSLTARMYFQGTTMFPPATSKKPFWKTLLQYAVRPFHAKPLTEPEKVNTYSTTT